MWSWELFSLSFSLPFCTSVGIVSMFFKVKCLLLLTTFCSFLLLTFHQPGCFRLQRVRNSTQNGLRKMKFIFLWHNPPVTKNCRASLAAASPSELGPILALDSSPWVLEPSTDSFGIPLFIIPLFNHTGWLYFLSNFSCTKKLWIYFLSSISPWSTSSQFPFLSQPQEWEGSDALI